MFKFIQPIDEEGLIDTVEDSLWGENDHDLQIVKQSLKVEQKFIMNDGKVLVLATVQTKLQLNTIF